MSQWVRADYNFDEPFAMLVIPRRRTEEIVNSLRNGPPDPETLCKWLTELVEYIRPDLKGVVLLAMEYDMRNQCYRVAAIHQNFPKRRNGEMSEEIRL